MSIINQKISKQKIAEHSHLHPVSFMTDIIKMSIDEDDNFFYFTQDGMNYLKEKYEKAPNAGPGTELKKLLGKIGIKATPNCSCNRKAIMMDINGPIWCENNIDIIVGWLREEAAKRRLPFVEYAAKLLIKKAIRNYRSTQSGN